MLQVQIYAGDETWVNAKTLFPSIRWAYFSKKSSEEALKLVEVMGYEGRIVEVEE